MATVAELKYKFTADTTQVNSALQTLNAQMKQSAQTVQNQFGQIQASLRTAGMALTAAVTVPFVMLAKSSVEAAGDVEAIKQSLIAVTGSAAAANKQFAQFKELAKAPVLEFEGIAKLGAQMQAARFSAAQTLSTLKEWGNAIAMGGGTMEEMAGALRQLNQMKGSGKILSIDLRVMRENMPILARGMHEAFGTASNEEIVKMGLSVDEFTDRLNKAMAGWKRVGGGIKNDIENLKIAFREWEAAIGKLLATGLRPLIGLSTKLLNILTELPAPVQILAVALGALAALAGPLLLLVSIIPNVVAGFALVSKALDKMIVRLQAARVSSAQLRTSLGATGAAGAAFDPNARQMIPAAGGAAASVTGGIMGSMRGLFGRIGQLFKGLWPMILRGLAAIPVWGWIAAGIILVIGLVVKFRNQLGLTNERLKRFWNGIKEGVKPIVDALRPVWDYIVNTVKSIWDNMKQTFAQIKAQFVAVWNALAPLRPVLIAILKVIAGLVALPLLAFLAGVVAWLKALQVAAMAVRWVFEFIGKLLGISLEKANKEAFTLKDLLATIARIAIQAAIEFPLLKAYKAAKQQNDAIKGQIELIREAMKAEKERMLQQVGFNSVRSLWNKGMEAGAKEVFSIRGTSMDSAGQIRHLEKQSKYLEQIMKYNKTMALWYEKHGYAPEGTFGKVAATFGP